MANLDADDRNADWLKVSARDKAERAGGDEVEVPDPYPAWLAAWWECARYEGASVADLDERVARLLELWSQPIGTVWCRQLDRQTLRSRYRRSDAGRAKSEHAIEAEVLAEPLSGLSCFLGPVLDGVNAVPLARDTTGGRRNNVEADLFLLIGHPDSHTDVAIVEVKDQSNTAWYAVVENLLQIRLARESASAQEIFDRRAEALGLSHESGASATFRGIVLAPRRFYEATGKKANAVAPARKLCHSFAERVGVTVSLAVWDSDGRSIAPYE